MLGRIQIDNEILIKFQTDEFFKNEKIVLKIGHFWIYLSEIDFMKIIK